MHNLVWGRFGRIFPDGYGADSSPFLAAPGELAVKFTVEDGNVTGFDLYADENSEKDLDLENLDLAELIPDAHFLKC